MSQIPGSHGFYFARGLCSIPQEHVGECEVRDMGIWHTWDDLPNNPWDEVVPGLWVGSSVRMTPMVGEFDHVVTMWHRAEPCEYGVKETSHWLKDADLTQLEKWHLYGTAVSIKNDLAEGRRVLIRCQLGLNRSALLAALVLVARGYTAETAIEVLRATRAKALANPAFPETIHEYWAANEQIRAAVR